MQLYLENMLPLINEVILYKSEFYRFVVGSDLCTRCYMVGSPWGCRKKEFFGKYDSII